jgi:hypothetical protein
MVAHLVRSISPRSSHYLDRDEVGQEMPPKAALKPGGQVLDPKTNRPQIESVLAYKEPEPGPKRTLKSKPGVVKQKKFVPRADYVNQPTAEEIRLALMREKAANLARGKLPEEPVPDPFPRVGEVKVTSLGMVTGKITAEGLSEAEKKRNATLKKAEAEEHRRSEEAMRQSGDCVVDTLTGQWKKKPSSPQKSQVASHVDEELVDIFGRPLPKRPPAAPTNATQTGATRELLEHYDRLLETVPRQALADAATKRELKFQDPTVGCVPGLSTSGVTRPPPLVLPEVDILGQPLKPGVSQVRPSAHRTKQFVTDPEPAQLFGDPAERLKLSKYSQLTPVGAWPGYIANPPPAGSRPPVPDLLKQRDPKGQVAIQTESNSTLKLDERRRRGPSSMLEEEPELNYAEAYAAFYASPTYGLLLAACKGWGIRRLRFALNAMDSDSDGILSKWELRNAVLKFGAELTDRDIDKLVELAPIVLPGKASAATVSPTPGSSASPPAATPSLLIPKLMMILKRGQANAKRRQTIAHCWKQALGLTKKSSGHMTLDDLESVVDLSAHKTFQPHVKGSMRQVAQAFTATWGGTIQSTTIIEEEMFYAFFEDMGVSYNKDSDFVTMMKGMFRLK